MPSHDPGHAFGTLIWRQQLHTWAPQILHAHDGRGQTLAGWLPLGLPVHRVASRRVTFLPSDGWTYRFKYGRTCQAVIAVSESIRELSVQSGVPRERITVIPDGIDLPAKLPGAVEKAQLRAKWKCHDDDFVAGLLGASTPEKGQDVAFKALALLAGKLPGARLVVAGDQSVVTNTSSCEQAGTLNERVIRLAPLEDLASFFPGLDLFVMPSKSEGLGSSALWAMGFGLPVIATRVGGLPEIVVDNETGWLIPPGSPEALAEAILAASRDRAKLIEYGRNGRKRAMGFSADIMVGRTEDLYHYLVSSSFP